MQGPQKLGKYTLLEVIGRGGAGVVYKARDEMLDRIVAVKTADLHTDKDPDLGQRFLREARATAHLSHDNIVKVYDVGEQDGQVYFVMEFVEGETLRDAMGRTKAREWPQFTNGLIQTAAALDYAHSKGLVHRDIKPGNIMLQKDGVVKVLDFGIARFSARSESTLTQPGDIFGTITYMAAEILEGQRADSRSDQFSLAVIAYTLLTGRRPFEGDSLAQVMSRIVFGQFTPPRELNPALTAGVESVLSRGLNRSAADRYPTCSEFILDLLTHAAMAGVLAGGQTVTLSLKVPPPVPVSWTPPPSKTEEFDRMFAPPMHQIPPAPPPRRVPAADFTMLDPRASKGWLGRLFDALTPHRDPPPPVAPPSNDSVLLAGEQTAMLRAPDRRPEPQVIAQAQAREIQEMLEAGDLTNLIDLRGRWLTGVEGADRELLSFRQAARFLAAAQNATGPHNRLEHLRRANAELITIGNQILQGRGSALAPFLPPALDAWKQYTRVRLAEAELAAASQLPNPFRAGQPLRPDQGQAVFRGREELVRQIESILADPKQSGSIALVGPRRCGKTSLLQMLPSLLPDCLCVFFDLQDNPVESTGSFFEALHRQAREQAARDRRMTIPPFPEGPSFDAANRWLQAMDRMESGHRVLLCIDEFERLEGLFPGTPQDLLRLMGLFRATIQHRRRVRLLVSGVAPFEELGQLWNDHFINVREIQVGHLDAETSIDLLRRPIPEFPPDAVPAEVAEEIYRRTAGQPYLLQLYGALLVTRLNEASRSVASLEDIPEVEAEAVTQGVYYLRNTWQDTPAAARGIIEALALGKEARFTPETRRWLRRRWLIDEQDRLRIPVLNDFVRSELTS